MGFPNHTVSGLLSGLEMFNLQFCKLFSSTHVAEWLDGLKGLIEWCEVWLPRERLFWVIWSSE